MNRTFRTLRSAALAGIVAAVASACATPAIEPQAAPAAPAAYKELDGRWAAATPADAQPRGAWWTGFDDPVLAELIARADANSTGVQVAAARLKQARAILRAADADRVPQLGLNAGATRGNLSTPGFSVPGTVYSAGLGASYELDLFGKLEKASSAAALDVDARAALLQSTRLAVQADVAQTYFALRALDSERALVLQTVAAYRDTLRLIEQRHQAGDIAELDLVRVQAEVAATESQALALDRRRAETEHALAVQLGATPASFTLREAELGGPLPLVPPGLPSTLLTRRPDVAGAQRAMLAAQARVGVAQTAWFPDIALTAAGGYASGDISDLFKWSARAWGVGAVLALPLFDGGRRAAAVDNANASWDIAAAAYRDQVLNAFREVEDQLAALRLLEQQAAAQRQAVTAATRATALSDARYRNGYVSQLDLLDARRSELANRREALQVRAAQYQATVSLIRALGGGWDASRLAAADDAAQRGGSADAPAVGTAGTAAGALNQAALGTTFADAGSPR